MTRERWLLDATEQMRPWFDDLDAALPTDIYISVGFPRGSRKAIGQCFPIQPATLDGKPHVFISPAVSEPTEVLEILLHELVHAALPARTGHKGPFQKLAGKLGLVKPWTATTASPDLAMRLGAMAEFLGDYPHGKLDPSDLKKGRSNPYLKCLCNACGFICYATPKMVDRETLWCLVCQASGFAGTVSLENPDEEIAA